MRMCNFLRAKAKRLRCLVQNQTVFSPLMFQYQMTPGGGGFFFFLNQLVLHVFNTYTECF